MTNNFFTPKQLEYIRNANRRWNIKTGAVRSGKTFTDFYLIPKRIRECGGGLIVFIGNTRSSLDRNIFEPMRKIWGEKLVGRINGDGMIRLFGADCCTIGASTSNACEKLQGCSVGYCYGDEITTWNEEMFRMLQSRLDRPDSRFDGTCNPASPDHWLRHFLNSDADIYCQHYTIDDNPHLDTAYVEFIKAAYRGTVYYDRYILGRWQAAEGIIYRCYADNPAAFTCSVPDGESFGEIICGLDFGGNRSKTAMVCSGIKYIREAGSDIMRPDVTVICSERRDIFSPAELTDALRGFCRHAEKLCGRLPNTVYCDNAEAMLIRGLRHDLSFDSSLCHTVIKPALKIRVSDRILRTLTLLSDNRLHLTEHASTLSSALSSAVWAKDSGGSESRRDDFTTDIDSLDAFEYSIERLDG